MGEKPDWYKSILDSLSEGLYVTNRNRKILYWNNTAEKLTGFCAHQVVGSFCYDNILMHIDENGTSLCNTLCPLAKTIQDGQVRSARVYLHHSDGQRIPVIVRINPIFDEGGNIVGAAELFTDDSSILTAINRISELEKDVYLDPLTETGNRRYAEMMLHDRLSESDGEQPSIGFLFIDVDRFKEINDNHGHLIGDRVLKMVAKTVQHNLFDTDFVARWGGDEFIVILHEIDDRKIHLVAEKIRILVESAILLLEEKQITATISIGGTILQADDSMETIIKRIDQGLYEAKTAGRNTIRIVHPPL